MIKIEHLNKSFGKHKILKDINLEFFPGEITGLIGINGSGKTTLMNCLARLIPYQGSIEVNGQPLLQSDARIWHVPDHLNFPRQMTIKECKDFMENLYPEWNVARANEMQAFFKFEDSTQLRHLSKGNQAKFNLLLGLALNADYLLLDEPFGGIDVFSREQILELFASFIEKECGVLITTHELYDVEQFIDRVVIINEGEIIQTAQLEAVRERHGLSLVDWLREELQ